LISTGVDQASSFIIIRLFILLISVLITGALILRWYRPQPQTQIVKVALMGSFPYAASEILNISAKRIDVLIVAVMLGGYPVGLYAPAVSVINAVLLLFDSISGVMLPVLSNLFAHDVELAWKYARRSLWLQSAAGLTLAISLSVTAKYFVTFLGDRYQGSLEPLLIMSAILFIHAFISSSANVLTSLNQQTKRTSIQAAGVFINVLLNIFIIPRFGISGAAAVYVVTEIFLAIGYSIGVLQSYYSRDLEKEETDRVKGVPTQPSDE
jgi:O-antigen/teichoic acid export membrane protein